jgi:hypothetical protein
VRKLSLKYTRAEKKTQVGVKLSAICMEAIQIAAGLSRNEKRRGKAANCVRETPDAS